MALPKVATPTYELKIPSTGKTVKFRPFLVKEEKLLMMASEGGSTVVSKAIKDVLQACTQTKIDISTLAPFDIEYFFLQIRGKSIGDELNIKLQRPDTMECECSVGETCDFTFNVKDIELDESKISDGKIELTGDIGIKLRYPNLDSMQQFLTGDKDPNADDIFKVISGCIEYIWEGEEIFKSEDATKKELDEFIESLNSEQFTQVRDFFENMPKLSKEIIWECPKCDSSTPVILEGIDSFFV